ncbi:SDR family NAD(P)-dependent oxidoreductase [Amphiplicatus metriothermophilus]|uniref:NAD(P)-dependent dehydrogenase, short-chain alcohol dehydrogenase family n=1 Tax=Amphiplicatus metriothermophilus TaxID=1519374 RepID=A0A239PPP0_9PROT|nr:SDR family NAD(P)-dependent oxidoreductase [Amphiplicatus metriothermophilus]MBB5518580.1 NAD(P)-dependent dehydrogenase (short-subunit alcohol dehydrogenase family) [Amphiplicatus metriothermophilus]SNT72261.1 NAD(P)-dependent dehydrogenase, short-chain alcohol dehydrogenase family [Amphiplicatus metriothermophilus]
MAGRSVVITGAASGVGAACARRFAAHGDRLVLADTDEERGKALAEEIAGKDGTATFVLADPANRLHVHNIVAEALEANGRIDVLAHMAGEEFSAAFLETSEEDFERVVARNLKNAFLVNQAVARQFVKQLEASDEEMRPGAIVNLMSVEAVVAAADHVVFAATQGGLHQMTKAIALALSPYGIRANAVGVGAIKNDFIDDGDRRLARRSVPLKRLGDPEEVAETVFFLASDAASYITGQCIYIDGGRMIRSGAPTKKTEEE